jgi:uncharacterized protein YjbJ (UPF0337 family)
MYADYRLRFDGRVRNGPAHERQHLTTREETQMNWEQVEGKWKQYTGQLKEKWGKLTDDDLKQIAGKRDQLVGKIQERYGVAKEEAERQINEFSASVKASEKAEKTHGAGR